MNSFWKKLKGISTPFGGVTWTPDPDERQVTYKLLQKLSNRRLIRVYHGGFEYAAVIHSCETMREDITDALVDVSPQSPLRSVLEDMRTAVHLFQNLVEQKYPSDQYPDRSLSADARVDNEILDALRGLQDFAGLAITRMSKICDLPLGENIKSSFRITQDGIKG